MKNLNLALFALLFSVTSWAQGLPIQRVYHYQSGLFNAGAAEIVAYDTLSQRIFLTNNASNNLEIFEFSNPNKSYKVTSVDLNTYGAEVNSVTALGNIVAVAMEPNLAQSAGKIVFFDTNGVYLNEVQVGAMPDMVAFSPNAQQILVANEGEPSDDYLQDPPGSVSIIDISSGSAQSLSQQNVHTISFARYDSLPYDPSIRVFGNNGNASFSQDMEPEYIAFNANGSKAYVVLQENNALAIINTQTLSLDTIVGLGYVDHSVAGNGLDASDRSSGINIQPHFNLRGLFLPDAIASYNAGGQTYLLTANEGDSRDYSGFSEEQRVGNINLNPIVFNSPSTVQQDTVLGRLKVTTTLGLGSSGFLYDTLYAFGTRSFSVWNDQGQLLWDSGDEFEQTLAQLHPGEFNSNNDDNQSFKSRSDDKGPEPEGICVGEVDGKTYAFIGLERIGGVMIYDISNPMAPVFDSYLLDRNFQVPASDTAAGDLGPEGLLFIKESSSPNGVPTLVVANEISGSMSVYQLGNKLSQARYPAPQLEVYPNPSEGIFYLPAGRTFKVYDRQGRFIKDYQEGRTLDLSEQPDGFYLLKSESGSTHRIIKK